MSEEFKPCDSRSYWWDTIRSIAENFETDLNSKGNKNAVFFQYEPEKLDSALEIYERGWQTFKDNVYGEAAKEERIDRHKITALYVLSFLIKRPFSVKAGRENEDKDKRQFFLANELFSLAVVQAMIFSWNRNFNIFRINENEKKWFIILLNLFKLKLKKLNPNYINSDYSGEADILSLAQIIYYIEKSCV